MKYGIFRHRKEWDPTWPESVKAGVYLPETLPINSVPSGGGKGPQLPILPKMWQYIRAINNDAGYKYARSIGMMWINTSYNPDDPNDIPRAESIRNSHNFCRIVDETDTHYRIAAFPHTEDLFANFDPARHNWYTMPDLFWKAIAADELNRHINVANGTNCFLPSLTRANTDGSVNPAYALKSRVEAFPDLPITVAVTADALNIRRVPSANSAVPVDGRYVKGDMVQVLRYALRGASVWGLTDKGWIALLYSVAPGSRVFFTSWSLATLGVIPPVPYAEPVPVIPPPPAPPFQKFIKYMDVTWQIDSAGSTETKRYE